VTYIPFPVLIRGPVTYGGVCLGLFVIFFLVVMGGAAWDIYHGYLKEDSTPEKAWLVALRNFLIKIAIVAPVAFFLVYYGKTNGYF
jgi:hypothetical protein